MRGRMDHRKQTCDTGTSVKGMLVLWNGRRTPSDDQKCEVSRYDSHSGFPPLDFLARTSPGAFRPGTVIAEAAAGARNTAAARNERRDSDIAGSATRPAERAGAPTTRPEVADASTPTTRKRTCPGEATGQPPCPQERLPSARLRCPAQPAQQLGHAWLRSGRAGAVRPGRSGTHHSARCATLAQICSSHLRRHCRLTARQK